jgi:hypothetical protein
LIEAKPIVISECFNDGVSTTASGHYRTVKTVGNHPYVLVKTCNIDIAQRGIPPQLLLLFIRFLLFILKTYTEIRAQNIHDYHTAITSGGFYNSSLVEHKKSDIGRFVE